MFRAKKSQMLFIEGKGGADLARQYNDAMNELTHKFATITDKIVDSERLTVVILYEVMEQVPECLKDEWALRGIFPTCSECPAFEPDGHHGGYCSRAAGRLREDDDICKARWREIEKEERRDVYAAKSCGGNGAARREPAAAR